MSTTDSYQLDEHREHPQAVADRRNKLANALERAGITLKFPKLLRRLGLESTYKDYEDSTGGMFGNISSDVATIGSAPLVEFSGNGGIESKRTYVQRFMDVVRLMRGRAAKVDALPKQYARTPYDILDSLNPSIDDNPFSLLDVAFVFNGQGEVTFSDTYIALKTEEYASGPNAHCQHIGHLADYALALWKRQPTRTFIPVLFLHGHQLDLLVFTRRGYFWAGVGPVLFTDRCDRERMSAKIGLSFQRLWFLLTLPAHKFGLLFNSRAIPSQLNIDASTTPATIAEIIDLDSTAVLVEKPIRRPVHITGRCTHLFNAKYGGEKVVLKLTWTRTDRLPEGAVYRVLEAHGVSNIPKIHKSGVIIKDFDGYRLEFLVMEHCGTPIVTHFQDMTKDGLPVSRVDMLVKDSVCNVVKTLTEALAANVLHRDISPGNIAIKNRTAYVIDWGCAKLLCPPADLTLRTEIAKHWSFDWDEVLETEQEKDSSTGTSLYMSTRLLLKTDTRGVYDDLESLFYVILDTLSDRPRTGKTGVQPPGFRFYDSSNMAMTRLFCTQSGALFLEHFGVILRRGSTLEYLLDAMRRFLFFDNGVHLGDKIFDQEGFSRKFDDSAAKVFMSDKTARELLRLTGGKEEDQSPLAVGTSTAIPSAQRPVHDSKPVLLPTPPYSVNSAERDILGEDDDVGKDNIATRSSNSDAVPGSLSSSRRGSLSTRSVPHFARQPDSSTSTRSPRTAIAMSTSQAAPSRIPACPAPSYSGAVLANKSSVNASNGKRLDQRQIQTRSHFKTPANQSSNLTKDSAGAMSKTKSKRGNPSKGATKRVSDNKSKDILQQPAKRRKH
ncbi:hypothetical protein GGI17_004149 [Coemansia sp. S146]|nr:hypothetical protein GGI17_004149 [Coemansia sp. S146]